MSLLKYFKKGGTLPTHKQTEIGQFLSEKANKRVLAIMKLQSLVKSANLISIQKRLGQKSANTQHSMVQQQQGGISEVNSVIYQKVHVPSESTRACTQLSWLHVQSMDADSLV